MKSMLCSANLFATSFIATCPRRNIFNGAVGYIQSTVYFVLLAMLSQPVNADIVCGSERYYVGEFAHDNALAAAEALSDPTCVVCIHPLSRPDRSSGWEPPTILAVCPNQVPNEFLDMYMLEIIQSPDVLNEMFFWGATEGCPDPEHVPDENGLCGSGVELARAAGGFSCPVNPGGAVGNPIDIGSGNKLQIETDYLGSGVMPLQYIRTFNSVRDGWQLSYTRHLQFDSATKRSLIRDSGKIEKYDLVSGSWVGHTDNPLLLEEDSAVPPTGNWLVHNENDEVETYDATGRLASVTNRAGQTTTFSYNGANQLTTVAHFSGRTLALTYDGSGRVDSMTDPATNVYTYGYDAQGRLETVTYPDTPAVRTYHYEDVSFSNYLTGITDANGDRFATWQFDSQGRATRSEHAGGVDRTDLAYNGDGTVSVMNPLLKLSIYTLDLQNGIRRVTQIDGQPTAMCGAMTSAVIYDANGYIASRTDENGNVTNFTYNARGLLETKVEAVGNSDERTTTTTWHAELRVPTQIVKPGQTIDMTYDAQGRLLTRTLTDTQTQSVPYAALGNTRTTTFTYTALGLVETIDGPRIDVSDVTTFAYDANGDLTTTTNALGQVTNVLTRDARGLPTLVSDVNGVTTDLAYDARGRLISRTVNGSQGSVPTSFVYDGVGQLTQITLPDGSQLNYEYDAAHRPLAIENNLGERIEYTLDNAGNRTGEVIKDDLGTITKTMTRVFDELSRLREHIGGSSQVTKFTYDDNGNQISIEDGLNRITNQAFDALDRLIQVTDPLTDNVDYSYDDRDNLASVTDPRGIVTRYVYDGLDNLIQEVSADAGTTVHLYDEAGNLVQSTDARAVVTDYTHDALNRVLAVNYPGDSSKNITYTYDQGLDGTGRLSSLTDASGSATYSYDDRGNISDDTRLVAGVIYVTSYTHDLADNLASMTYPSGRTVTYTRDTLGRISGVTTQGMGGPVETVVSNVGYLPFGATTGWTAGNGLVETRLYTQDYWVKDLIVGSVINRNFIYTGGAQTLDEIRNSLDPSRSQTFGYDELYRLTSASGIYGSLTYSYDEVGNRLTFNDGATVESYTYGAADNRLTNSTQWDYQYDAVGNQSAQLIPGSTDGTLFGYDDRNRLEAVTDRTGAVDTTLATYEYNALGQRTIKSATNNLHFVYDANGLLIAEADDTGNTRTEYIYLDGTLIGVLEQADAPTQVIMDNLDAGTSQSGTWTTKTSRRGDHYQTNYLLAKKNTNATFRWTPTLDAGTYEVYAWWVAQKKHNRSVTYTIVHGGTSDQVAENHRQNGGQWVLLGAYGFSGDGSEYVEVADQGGNSVADAIRFLPVATPTEVIMDNLGGGTSQTGIWNVETASDGSDWASDHLSAPAFSDSAFRYTPTLTAGTYDVYAWWPNDLQTYTAKYSIHHDGATDVSMQSQSINGEQWNLLGTYAFVGDGSEYIEVIENSSFLVLPVVADAVRFVPASGGGEPTLFHVHTDHLGTPQAITDFTQQVVWQGDYLPFGGVIETVNTLENRIRFPGQYFDAESGLHYNFFRDYDPTMGRFIQSDPIGLEGGSNLYTYVDSTPLMQSDPSGLMPSNPWNAYQRATAGSGLDRKETSLAYRGQQLARYGRGSRGSADELVKSGLAGLADACSMYNIGSKIRQFYLERDFMLDSTSSCETVYWQIDAQVAQGSRTLGLAGCASDLVWRLGKTPGEVNRYFAEPLSGHLFFRWIVVERGSEQGRQ